MKEFKLGQRVKIVDAVVATRWCIEDFLGEEFVVDELHLNSDGEFNAMHKGYYVPVQACELIEDINIIEKYAIKHTAYNSYHPQLLLYGVNQYTYDTKEGAERNCEFLNKSTNTTWEVKRWKITEEDV